MANPLLEVTRAAAKLHKSQAALDQAREDFYAAVREAAKAGVSYSAMSRVASVSRQWIAQIVERGS